MYPSQASPYRGIFVKNVEDGLKQAGAEVSALTALRFKRNKVAYLFAYGWFYLQALVDGFLVHFDVCYIHFPKRSAIPAALIAKLKGKPVVLNYHGTDIRLSRIERLVNGIALRLSAMSIAPSDWFASELARMFHISRDSIYVSPSGGIDDSFTTRDSSQPNPGTSVGFVSRISGDKGWRTLIEAARVLDNWGLRFAFAGGGPEYADLLAFSGDLAGNRIEILGPIPHNELPDLYRSLSVFVFPSLRAQTESLGLVGLEAMGCGVPVIGSDLGGISGYVQDGINGYLFEPGNADDLALKIKTYLELPESKREKMRVEALATADKYRRIAVCKALYDRLRRVVASHRGT